MFPTFISILDIQSWWEVPSIAHFCSLFRSAFNLLDFDIEDLEEALLTDGTEETSWLQELIVRLLTGCLPNNEISTFNYQMFLRRLFREKCKEHDQYNPFNTDIDFQLLPLRTKVDILHALCDFRLDADDVLEQLKNLEADSLRVEPLGYDDNESAFWYFYGTRLYREDFKTKNNKKVKSVWQVVCFTEEDWFQLAKKFKKSQSKTERQLFRTLTENFLPELPRLFREKEKLTRKRLLDNQPRRTSSRLDGKRKQELAEEGDKTKLPVVTEVDKEEEEKSKKRELERRRQEAYERRARLRDKSGEEQLSERGRSETPERRHEMAGNKTRDKKPKTRQRQNSGSSSSSRDHGSAVTRTSNRNSNRSNARSSNKTSSSSSTTSKSGSTSSTAVGRQTNNSLASATGQIVIQPVSNPHRKKLKTSQVFRQSDEDLQTGMHKILDYVKNHEDAWPFIDPVEEEYAPNYYSVIRKPMDLQRMEERLDTGYYKSFSRFRGDFQLIVDNCRLYNGADNEYTDMVGNLLKVFEKATERFLDQGTSSDEEIAVEFPEADPESKLPDAKKKKKEKEVASTPTKRKPTLAAQTDKKRERSVSEDSFDKHEYASDKADSVKNIKKPPKRNVQEETKTTVKKQQKNAKSIKPNPKENKKKPHKNVKMGRKPLKRSSSPSPVRSRSHSRSLKSQSRSLRSLSRDNWSSSPPPSWPPSSPDSRFDFSLKKSNRKENQFASSDKQNKSKMKEKQRDKWKDGFTDDNLVPWAHKKSVKQKERSPSPRSPKQSLKPKDKHNKLSETIEKLKAKSEMSKKLKENTYVDVDADKKVNKDNRKDRPDNKSNRKQDVKKTKHKEKSNKIAKKIIDHDDDYSTADSVQSENKKQVKKGTVKNLGTKNAAIEALTLATEQTLKDINEWLDDTPRLSEFSSASNSPSHYIGAEEFDSIGNKIEQDYRKRLEKPLPRKDGFGKDIKRRPFHRDPTKFLKRREVQRTIDRLQPGKSKGNLLSNIQNTNKADELYPLGPLSKIKDAKNSLIVKTNESAPKLSLGSVLDSFGKHKFVDDAKKEDEKEDIIKKEDSKESIPFKTESTDSKPEPFKNLKAEEVKDKKPEIAPVQKDAGIGKATPNLSAWFKAFGAPKVQATPKKSEIKTEPKETEKSEDVTKTAEPKSKDENKKILPPDPSPNPDSPVPPGQPIPRQRKISTGSSVSERSSFSQDMDSPRVGIDERLGTYPAPYPSPLHRSPSGASPAMASPRPDVSPKAYPPLNGQIRVGFYQDTVSTKSSPDKSCSPRENPQSPYPQYAEQHVYTTPTTTQNTTYTFNNPPYYSQTPNYSNSNPTTPYNAEQSNANSYYDTSKPLTDQYQARATPGYHSVNSPNYNSVNSPNYNAANSPNYQGVASPSFQPSDSSNYQAVNSPAPNQLPSPAPQLSPGYDTFQQQQQQTNRLPEKQQNASFPVKKRAYNETDSQQLTASRYDADQRSLQQQEQTNYNRSLEMGLMSGRQLSMGSAPQTAQPQDMRPNSQSTAQQNVTESRPLSGGVTQSVQQRTVSREAPALQQPVPESMHNTMRNINYPNPYTYPNESGYTLNVPTGRTLDLNARIEAERKMDMSKYTNMGYTGSDMGFNRNPQYNRPDLNYSRSVAPPTTKPNELQSSVGSNTQSGEAGRYGDPNVPATYAGATQQPAHAANMPQSTRGSASDAVQNCLSQPLDVPSSYKPPEMSIPRPTYSAPSTLAMDQSLGLRGNLSNLTHIVDRYQADERMLSGLQQSASSYYAEKGLPTAHMYNKPMATSSSSLPMFSQPNMAMAYSHEMQQASSTYNRQMTELQNSALANQPKPANLSQQQQPEKKSKRRKNHKSTPPSVEAATNNTSNQGFQSYTGLKNNSAMEPSAISLKTASVVPGSAFNFGPAPTGLGLSSGLYGDKDAYPNFLEDYRSAPNYYMAAAAAAAHHRSTPESADKQNRTTHQSSATPTPSYPFIGAPQPRPPNYPLSGHFMPPHQGPPLMDASSPLYQQYLQAGVLHQGLLGPPGPYPPGYHPALSMRQPFETIPRHSWL